MLLQALMMSRSPREWEVRAAALSKLRFTWSKKLTGWFVMRIGFLGRFPWENKSPESCHQAFEVPGSDSILIRPPQPRPASRSHGKPPSRPPDRAAAALLLTIHPPSVPENFRLSFP